MSAARKRVLVTGAGLNLTPDEESTAELLGGLLARQSYDLIAGTWGGVDEYVTKGFLAAVPHEDQPSRITHIENHDWRSKHDIRVGPVIRSSSHTKVAEEAVAMADLGVVVSGRQGSKPTMDALLRRGKPVLPLAWFGNDAFYCLQDVLREYGSSWTSRDDRRLLLSLIDPATATDETLSRLLGAWLAPADEIFISYHHEDSGPDAGRLGAHLALMYGKRRVFLDYKSLHVADVIDTVVEKAARCRILVVLIGPNFVERVRDETDYVRREVTSALEHGATVLPLLVAQDRPSRADLPLPLQRLADTLVTALDRLRWEVVMHEVEGKVDAALGISRLRPDVMAGR